MRNIPQATQVTHIVEKVVDLHVGDEFKRTAAILLNALSDVDKYDVVQKLGVINK